MRSRRFTVVVDDIDEETEDKLVDWIIQFEDNTLGITMALFVDDAPEDEEPEP